MVKIVCDSCQEDMRGMSEMSWLIVISQGKCRWMTIFKHYWQNKEKGECFRNPPNRQVYYNTIC